MSNDERRKPLSFLKIAGLVVGAWLALWMVIAFFSWLGARATPQAGEVGVVRSGPSHVWIGSFFNGHGIRGVIPPGSGSTYIGLGSTVHYYPADTVQRNYTITSDPGRGDVPGVDVVEVPTSNGVRVGLEGTFYFTTNFDASPAGKKSVEDFDNRFGVRTFAVVGSASNKEAHPYDGTEGWEAMLDTVIRPIINNDLRRSIASVTCQQLVSSCALINNQNASALTGGNNNNNAEIQQIQDQINASLQSDIKTTLGRDYFSNVQFLLARVTLPDAVQNQIDNAQAQYASVGAARAEVQRNIQLATAKAELQKAYANCPACATIDELKAIPSNVTTFAPGAGFAITQPTTK